MLEDRPARIPDWDILVLLNKDDVTLKTEQQFRHHMFDIEFEIGEPISVFIRSKSVWESKYRITPIYNKVKAEEIKI